MQHRRGHDVTRIEPLPVRSRFTLIELLVVVAIIAVLAAMLLPVLGRARYRASLTGCTNNLRQMGMGLTSYSGDFDAYYPVRSVNRHPTSAEPACFRMDTAGVIKDDRATVRAYMPLSTIYNCPLSPLNADMNMETSTSKVIYINYDLFYGSRILATNPKTNMARVGDHMTYGGKEFRMLAADQDDKWSTGAYDARRTGHPRRNDGSKYGAGESTGYFISWWISLTPNRNAMDRNALFDDGSVTLYSQLRTEDPRQTSIPLFATNTGHPTRTYLLQQ